MRGFFRIYMTTELFTADNLLATLVTRASRALVNRLQAVFDSKGYDITVEQWMIMLLLWQENGQYQRQLAQNIGKDKTTVTRLVDGLERRDLVVRKPGSRDRRQKAVYLTPRGKKLERDLIPLGIANAQQAQKGISPEELSVCKDVLRRVHSNLLEKNPESRP
jgi:DNA-binding MarR family transcriptional regulator